MGKVTMTNGIGYSERSGARYIDLSAIASNEQKMQQPIKQAIPDDKLSAMPWSPWGTNNLKPIEMATDIEECGILNSIIDGKARFAICSGPVPVTTFINKTTGKREVKEYIDDPEIINFLDRNNAYFQTYGWTKDLIGFAQCVASFGLSREKTPKIISFERTDVTEFRYAKQNSKGLIENLWISAEWNKVRSATDSRVFSVPNLNPFNPAADLLNKSKGSKTRHFAMTCKYPGWNRHYYSLPLWYAAYKWVKIAQGVPEMKASIFENSLHIKYVVTIYEKYWEKAFGAEWKKYTPDQKREKQKAVYDDIDEFLVGSKNAYKSIFTTGYRDQNGKTYTEIEIKSVEDYQKDGKLLPDSAAANSEIAFAMHFNNAIIGGNQSSGLYEQSQGGSNVRESILLQVILHEMERQYVRRMLMVPAEFNGWTKRHPGLDFIIPAEILTTLDTGAGSKAVIPGNNKPNSDGSN